jgi:hypothetical protein
MAEARLLPFGGNRAARCGFGSWCRDAPTRGSADVAPFPDGTRPWRWVAEASPLPFRGNRAARSGFRGMPGWGEGKSSRPRSVEQDRDPWSAASSWCQRSLVSSAIPLISINSASMISRSRIAIPAWHMPTSGSLCDWPIDHRSAAEVNISRLPIVMALEYQRRREELRSLWDAMPDRWEV